MRALGLRSVYDYTKSKEHFCLHKATNTTFESNDRFHFFRASASWTNDGLSSWPCRWPDLAKTISRQPASDNDWTVWSDCAIQPIPRSDSRRQPGTRGGQTVKKKNRKKCFGS